MPRRTLFFAASLVAAALIAALLAACLAPPAAAQPPGTRLAGVVSHVADGDTLDLKAGGRTYTIRLDGIDAPEGGQAFSQQARQHLRVLAFSQQATVAVQTTDRYGRLVARVTVGGRDLGEEMLKAGLAWHFVRYSSDARLHALEQQARQQRLGLWADRSAIPPWQYRSERAARSAGSGGTSASPSSGKPSAAKPSSPGRAAPPAAARPGSSSPVSGPFHGNVSSRVYHAPGCRDYNCRHCTAVFATRAAAEAAGYRPHAACVRSPAP